MIFYFNAPPKEFGIKTHFKEKTFGHYIKRGSKRTDINPTCFNKKNISLKNLDQLKKKLNIERIYMFDRILGLNKNILITDHINRSGLSFLRGETPYKKKHMFQDLSKIYNYIYNYVDRENVGQVILCGDRREMIFAAWHSLSNDLVANDTSAMLDFLSDDPNDSDGPMGCVGYCMSGAFVVTVAGSFPDRFSAIASLYGVWIVTDKDDSPHLLADKFKGEFYLAFAEHDQWVGDNVIPDLQNALTKNEIKHEIETFPGTEHGYSFPERDVYNEGAAEATWKKIENLYARVLG